MQKELQFHLIGTADFATGERFSIHKFDKTPGCIITDLRTGNKTRAGTVEKAWSAVRYLARVSQRDEHTPGVEAADYYKLVREVEKRQ